MNSSRQARIQQERIARQAATCDANAFFNLLTDEALFDKLEQLLPDHRERVYTPTETLSMFLTQTLHADRSCQQIVNQTVLARASAGMNTLSTNTGAYCRARQRLPLALPRELSRHCAAQMMSRLPHHWLWQGRSVKIADGTTLSMPDTPSTKLALPNPSPSSPVSGFQSVVWWV